MSEVSKENRRPYDLQYWPAISVSIEVPVEPGDPDPVTELPDEMLIEFDDNPPGAPSGAPVIRPFAYFKYVGKIDSDNPLILKVWYSPKAWEVSSNAGGKLRPRIYIRKYQGEWADNWEEIIENITPKEPGVDGILFGYLKVKYYEIPDPAIGGC